MDASALASVLERLEREDKVQDDALLQVAEGILSDTDAIFQPFFQCEAPARGLDALFGATSPLGSGLVAERVTPTLKSYLAGALEQGGGFDDVCLVFGGVGADATEQIRLAARLCPAAAPLVRGVATALTDSVHWKSYKETSGSRMPEGLVADDGRDSILESVDAMLAFLRGGDIEGLVGFCAQETGSGKRPVGEIAAVALPLITLTQLVTLICSFRSEGIHLSGLFGSVRNLCGHSAGMIAAVAAARMIDIYPPGDPAPDDPLFIQVICEAVLSSAVLGIELTLRCGYGMGSPMLAVKGPGHQELSAIVERENREAARRTGSGRGTGTLGKGEVTIAVVNDGSSHVLVGAPDALRANRTKLPSNAKTVFLRTDVPFHSKETAGAAASVVGILRSMGLSFCALGLKTRVLCCGDGCDIRSRRKRPRNAPDLLDAIVSAVATNPVNWPDVSVSCGGALVVDVGPGTVSGFGMDDACLKRHYPRPGHSCCDDYNDDPLRNPLAVCHHCGGYSRRGASFSVGAMLKAQDALNELNTAFFTVYDPITDALIDERGVFFDM